MPGGTGCVTGFLQKFFYSVLFLGLTQSTSLKSPNTPSGIIEFPFSLFLGKGFSVEPEVFPCQRKPLLPPPHFLCVPKHPWGSELQWDISASKKGDWLGDPSRVGCGSSLWKHSYPKPSLINLRSAWDGTCLSFLCSRLVSDSEICPSALAGSA